MGGFGSITYPTVGSDTDGASTNFASAFEWDEIAIWDHALSLAELAELDAYETATHSLNYIAKIVDPLLI
jgi:hypothetical protein